MATYLFAWELGSGLGHVTVIKPLAALLRSRGHRVVVALRDLSNAERIFGDCDVAWLQAPIRLGTPKSPIVPTRTFAQLLNNTVFAERDEALGRVKAWLHLFDLVKPDVLVADHSPTPLLAARARPTIKRATLGPGFYCPAPCEAYPDWRPWLGEASAKLQDDEARVLKNVNLMSQAIGGRGLQTLSHLYAGDLTLLGTFPELDPFGHRPNIRYRGVWGHGQGVSPWWPPGYGKRIFAYVRDFAGLDNLLSVLDEAKQRTIVFSPGMADQASKTRTYRRIAFARKPVELGAAATQCDVAISHGSHGTAAAMLFAGKPQLLFPSHLEQRLTTQAIVSMGAGLAAKPDQREHIRTRLTKLLTDSRYYLAAQAFQKRHQSISPAQEITKAVDDLESLGCVAKLI